MLSTYLTNLYPGPLIYDMMTMSLPTGEKEGTPPVPFYRDLALRSGQSYWWRDGTHSIKSKEDFFRQILARQPYQIHFDLLHIYNQGNKELYTMREIVFDIDVTDFNRYCECQGGCCKQCWLHIEGASLILSYILTEVLAIPEKNILWVLSGKKGIHCLVNQSNYLRMGKEQRENIYKFICKTSLEQLSEFASSLSFDFTLLLIKVFYERVIKERRLLENQKFVDRCLVILKSRYPSLYNPVALKWHHLRKSVERWEYLVGIEAGQFDDTVIKPSLLIILWCYYPKIDKGPLYEKRHLFKLPFSIHLDTYKIALPVSSEGIMNYELPNDILSLEEVTTYYKENDEGIHPDFMEGCLLLETWLNDNNQTLYYF